MTTFIVGIMAGFGFGATFSAILSRVVKTPAPAVTVGLFALSGMPAFAFGLYIALQH